MLSFSPVKLLIVLVVASVLVGPDKLPQVARQLGAAWRTFRTFHQRVEEEVRNSLPDLPSTAKIAGLARSPVALLNQLADLSSAEASASVVGDDGNTADGDGEKSHVADSGPRVGGGVSGEAAETTPDPSMN